MICRRQLSVRNERQLGVRERLSMCRGGRADDENGAARQEEARFMDVIKEDMQRGGVTEDDAGKGRGGGRAAVATRSRAEIR